MTAFDGRALRFGPDVIRLLLPHRRPLLLVDAVTGYAREPRPTLHAEKLVSAGEPVFTGHFPGLHLWPGVYTIEGLAQTTSLLHVLDGLERAAAEQGDSPDSVFAGLENLERRATLHPGYRADRSAALEVGLARAHAVEGSIGFGVMAAVDVKLLFPVFAGQLLAYRVSRTHVLGEQMRFDVDASVAGRVVARGTLHSVRMPFPSRDSVE